MLKIVVLLKQTFDTEEKITVTPAGIDERDTKFVINPYDEYALEEALRQRELHGGEVISVSCGPERTQDALRTALAIGADEAIRLDSANVPDDGSSVAAALAAVIQPLAPDLLLAGLFAVDSGSGSVALQVAERLQLPHASSAVKVTILRAEELEGLDGEGAAGGGTSRTSGAAALGDGTSKSSSVADGDASITSAVPASSGDGTSKSPSAADGEAGITSASPNAQNNGGTNNAAATLSAERYALVERDVEGDTETVSIPLPALITAQQGLNEPRYPSLPGIMKAKRKPLRTVTLEELISSGALSPESVSPRTSRSELLSPPPRAAGKRLPGAPAEQATALVSLLREEAKLL
ncbi:electron transfer flavoprotein subunit beta/FixA family protein [Paenibacillus luteus]|uniref:electron transfer flavoprotein subunit beta/FixA family protein n=1 Tax=Paenibacillus luteus TaxID=2545753 RepID=UPI00240D50B2|nr:electron transfer flavoprotein subunit beta/FixA family protein [Paenibacillus luteus]